MQKELDEFEKYQHVQRRMSAVKRFYFHALVYILMNMLLLVVNVITSPERLWFYYPLLGWGLLLLGHEIFVFERSGYFNKRSESEQRVPELSELNEARERERV